MKISLYQIADWYRLKGCPKSRSSIGTINAVLKVDRLLVQPDAVLKVHRLLVQLVLYQKSIDFWYSLMLSQKYEAPLWTKVKSKA